MAKRKAPQPSYDNDGDINNSGSTSSINNSDDAATALGPPHKKSKKESLIVDDVASTDDDDNVVVLQTSRSDRPTSSSVRGRSDDRRENRGTAMKASASSGGRIPTNIISTLQSARKNNAQVANDNNDNAFLKSTREEKIHEPIAVLSKDNDDNDNATTTTKPRAPTLFAAPSSLLMNGRSTTNVGQGSGKRLVLYLSLLVLNITTLIIQLIVIINGLSNKSYDDDTLYDQYMGQVQQIESSILQCHKDEMLLLSSIRKLEQDVHLILQRSVVAMEEIDFVVSIMDGDDNTTTTTIQSREDEYAWIENGRILLDVERNRGMNIIWSTTIDEIKNDILSPYYDDDTSTPPPPVVINDEKTSTTLMDAHTAGKIGDISALIAIATKDIMLFQVYDNNGWTPLHEAARGGHLEAVQFLVVEVGLDKNERTNSGRGGSPIWWARNENGDEHPVVQYLQSIGAVDISPG